ncbi:MAG TPA: adenylyltransferase/cytidyltransferase family protein [Candidatus Thermoplasmatota archaeon]|nr:adenylyltransferase/cytidyltransferase family protein [Candidatus Thermoplasmatota archaeon]
MRALVLGRFQPLHNGHKALIQEALGRGATVIVAIGSSAAKPGLRNPFTTAERRQMVEATFPNEMRSGAVVLAEVPDLHDPMRYVAHTLAITGPVDAVFGNDDETLGLFERAGMRIESPGLVDRARFEAKAIRAQIAADDGAWRKSVPPAVAELLVRLDAGRRLRGLEAYA